MGGSGRRKSGRRRSGDRQASARRNPKGNSRVTCAEINREVATWPENWQTRFAGFEMVCGTQKAYERVMCERTPSRCGGRQGSGSVRAARRRNPARPVWLVPAAIAAATFVFTTTATLLLLRRGALPPGIVPPAEIAGIPFARGAARPVWPVVTNDERIGQVAYKGVDGEWYGRQARSFGAVRPDGRRHAGIDLFSNSGDPVIATEDGTVINVQSFNLGTDAVLVKNDSGLFVLYGEVDRGSPSDYGVVEGGRVKKGKQIARVGCMVHDGGYCSSHMLHFETYDCCPEHNEPWYSGSPPAELRDPSEYLLRASRGVRTVA